MKYFVVIVILTLTTTKAMSAEILLSPFWGYGKSNFYGQTSIPSYVGSQYGGALEFRQAWGSFGLGIYGQYAQGEFDNTNNNNSQKEFLETTHITFGFKFHYDNLYLKAGYGINKTQDQSRGTVNKDIDLKDDLYQAGLGISWALTSYVKFFFEAEANYSSFKPEAGGLTKETKLTTYTGIIGFTFLIPSSITGIDGTSGSRNGFEL